MKMCNIRTCAQDWATKWEKIYQYTHKKRQPKQKKIITIICEEKITCFTLLGKKLTYMHAEEGRTVSFKMVNKNKRNKKNII